MKLRVNKKWWQFWLPTYANIADDVVRQAVLPSTADSVLNSKELPKRGRVVKVAAPPEYTPSAKHSGGRVIKAMPRQLKKIKEAQEKVADE